MPYHAYLVIALTLTFANFATLANDKVNIKPKTANSAKSDAKTANSAKLPVANGKKVAFKKLRDGKIQLGKIIVNPKKYELSFPATINLEMGVLEAIISTPNGRLHESLLKSEIKALHLQTCLYLLGAKNGTCLPSKKKKKKDEKNNQGDIFDIELEWKDMYDNKKREPIEKWIHDVKTFKCMKKYGWVFVGSSIIAGDFAADLTGNLVICYHVANTILDFPNAKGRDDIMFVVNEKKKKPGMNKKVMVFMTLRKKKLGENK